MAEIDRDIKLDNRLLQCASYVRNNSRIVDVGTDHAYLAIHLVKGRKASSVVASDLRKGPLNNALMNIKRYGCGGLIKTRLSDGLKSIDSSEVDDVIVAGMGGEVIAKIISGAEWLKSNEKRLILQPMTMAEHLRRFLFDEGFKILEESAVISGGKVYTVMLASFRGENLEVTDLYPYIGGLEQNIDAAAIKYIEKEIRELGNKILGYKCRGDLAGANKLSVVKDKLEKLVNGV